MARAPKDKQEPIQSSERNRPPILTTKNLSIVVTGGVTLAAILKANPEDIPVIAKTLVESTPWGATGWAIAVTILVGSVFVINLQRNIFDKEMSRIAKERDELQSILMNRISEERAARALPDSEGK